MSKAKSDIISLISAKPSYLKEGSRRLSKKFGCSREEAREAIREAREIIKGSSEELNKSHEGTLNVRSVWQGPDGKWLYSYRNQGEALDKERIERIVQDSIKDVKPASISSKDPKENDKGLFVWTSDKHVGASVDSSIYDNDYDKEEFDRRMLKVVEKCVELKNIFGKFDHIFLADLGDPLDGMDNTTVRGGHDLQQNMSNEEQAKTYIEVMKRVIDTLVEADIAEIYTIWNVCNDNHSGSFGYVANLAISEYVKVKYPNIYIHNQEKFIEHTSYGIHDFVLTHGKDTEDRKKGLPLNLDDSTEKYILEYMDYHNLKGAYKHFIKGDLHRSAENVTSKFRYKNCPSVFGASKWIHHNFGKGSPACDIEVVDRDEPDVFKFTLNLG